MSDFDKEAERERLREKYEQDKADREVTERMSDLLLKGATMTNAHCSDCGDPIFRYDGQEFCPTCEKPVDRGDPAGDDSDGDVAASDGADPDGPADSEHIEVATPGEDARVRFGDADADSADSSPDGSAQQPQTNPRGRGHSPGHEHSAPDPQPDTPSDVARTHAELHGRIRQLSQRAGACDDPRDAEAFLSAAREAAEALAALRG